MTEKLQIRSYRKVFKIDRKLYKVDRWYLPVPGGVPLRGLGYFTLALLAILVLGQLPIFGLVLSLLSPPLRYVILPIGVAIYGMQHHPDGRTAHRFALQWFMFKLRARRCCANHPVPLDGEPVKWAGRVGVRHDAHSASLRHARITGVARVIFNVPVTMRRGWRGSLVVTGASDGVAPQTIVTNAAQTVRVRP